MDKAHSERQLSASTMVPVFMKPTNHDLEAISVRRVNVADGGVVRYRVYTTPSDYSVVIADSALMAVKVSGVTKPYKIVRDLLTDGIGVDAQKMLPPTEKSKERVSFRTAELEKTDLHAELPESKAVAEEIFVPLGITELRSKGGARVRILSPDMVNEIIEEHTKKQQAVESPITEERVIPHVAEPLLPPAEPTIEERMTKLAEEVLPSIEDLDPEHHPKPPERKELSKEEVEKLLNG